MEFLALKLISKMLQPVHLQQITLLLDITLSVLTGFSEGISYPAATNFQQELPTIRVPTRRTTDT